MISALLRMLSAFFLLVPGLARSAEFEFQKQPGFVGFVAAGVEVQVTTVNPESQTLNLVASDQKSVGPLQVTYKNFERALGGNKKIEFLQKQGALAGKTFKLKNNLVLLPL